MNFEFTGSNLTGLLGFFAKWSQIDILWSIGVSVLRVLVHIVFAGAVYRDAKHLQTPIFLGPRLWFVATLVGGVITAAIYWAMHHSRLNPAIPALSTESDQTEV